MGESSPIERCEGFRYFESGIWYLHNCHDLTLSHADEKMAPVRDFGKRTTFDPGTTSFGRGTYFLDWPATSGERNLLEAGCREASDICWISGRTDAGGVSFMT